ncbi:MAG: cyclic nucleotide-binding domain-containing protein [Actinomycetota bacterium]
MKTADIVEMLEQVKLFRGLNRSQLAKVARVTDVRKARAGEKVVREGTFRSGGGPAFFMIAEGTADVIVRGKKVATLHEGDSFGEMTLLDGQARSATVTAKTDMILYRLLAWHFTKLIKSEPAVAIALLKTLAERLRKAEKTKI